MEIKIFFFFYKREHTKGNRMEDNLQCLKVTKGLLLKIYKELLENKKKNSSRKKEAKDMNKQFIEETQTFQKLMKRW